MGKKPKDGKKVRAAGIVIFTKTDPQYFLLMRHANRWDLPKGHCEQEETYLETALRETEEETGISPNDIQVDDEFQFKLEYPVKYKRWGGKVFTKKVKYFLGFVKQQPKLNLTEHESAEWFQWDPPHSIQEATIDPVLAAVAEHLGNTIDSSTLE